MTATARASRRHPLRLRVRLPRAVRTPLGCLGAIVALGWVVVAVTARWWLPYDPLAQDLPRLQPPGPTLLGTDGTGRDLFSRSPSRSRSSW